MNRGMPFGNKAWILIYGLAFALLPAISRGDAKADQASPGSAAGGSATVVNAAPAATSAGEQHIGSRAGAPATAGKVRHKVRTPAAIANPAGNDGAHDQDDNSGQGNSSATGGQQGTGETDGSQTGQVVQTDGEQGSEGIPTAAFTPPAVEDTSLLGEGSRWLLLPVTALFIVAAIGWFLFNERRHDRSRQSARNRPISDQRIPAPKAHGDPTPRQGLGEVGVQDFNKLTKRVDQLENRAYELEEKITWLGGKISDASIRFAEDQSVETGVQPTRQSFSRYSGNADYDRLPADRETNRARPVSESREPATTPPIEQMLVDRINNAVKSDADIREELGVRFFSNDRTTDTSLLSESETDRFWLLADPANPGEAFMVPGLNTRANWARLRQDAADHPLAHHFELSSGEKFVVLRPARLRRNTSGGWDLDKPGAVSGLS